MKLRTVIVAGCLMSVVVLFFGYQANSAESDTGKPGLTIGVVNVKKIFQDCKESAAYRQQALAERNKIEAELSKLNKEIEAETAGLATLKEGSSDYMSLVKEIMIKQANLQAQQKFYEQQMALKEQMMIKHLYAKILKQVSEVARQKELDLVLERSEPDDIDVLGANELTLTISTHKVLYGGGCMDLTDEVTARLDAGK